jgi:hypothetical protein
MFNFKEPKLFNNFILFFQMFLNYGFIMGQNM